MNVSKALNLTIVFFIILNVALGVLLYVRDTKYQLSDKQQRDIIELLSNNKIGLYKKPIVSYRPLRQIKLSQEYMDADFMIKWLFADDDEILKTEEFNKIIYTSGRKTLSYDYRQFSFEDASGSEHINLNIESARALCDKKLDELRVPGLQFKLDNSYGSEDGASIVFEYRADFDGNVVYSSFVRFRVSEAGISHIRAALLVPLGYVDSAREIYSSDEALLALMYELKSIYGETNIIIDRLDMVYYGESGRSGESGEIKGVPCYRVYISDRQEPFLLNAYFNTFIR